LRAAFARWRDHLRTGILSTAHLLEVLVEAGLTDVAWKILSDDTFPSCGYFVKKGATTVPEWWDAWGDGNEVTEYWQSFTGDRAQGELPGSLNHPVFGAILEGIVRYVWGLRQAPGSAGYREVIIAPVFTDKLDCVSGRFRSARGTYALAWRRATDAIEYRISIPAGCAATLIPPRRDAVPIILNPGETEIAIDSKSGH